MKKRIILLLCFAFVTVFAWANMPGEHNNCLLSDENGDPVPASAYCNKVIDTGTYIEWRCQNKPKGLAQAMTCYGNKPE